MFQTNKMHRERIKFYGNMTVSAVDTLYFNVSSLGIVLGKPKKDTHTQMKFWM